jgi:DNA-binding GntR family transcriptional regulator
MNSSSALAEAARMPTGRGDQVEHSRGSETPSTIDRIITGLQSDIITGAIPIGTWLRHGALAERFSVSRTPVREALRVLAAQGVVTIVPNRGARVNGLSGRDIRELGEVRAQLQGLAAGLAAQRVTDEQLDVISHTWDGFRDALEDPDRREQLGALWAEANETFHSVIVSAADNHQLSLTLNDLHHRMPRNLSFGAYEGKTHLLRRNLEEHAEIARALADHDPVRANALMIAHFKDANQATALWVEMRIDG